MDTSKNEISLSSIFRKARRFRCFFFPKPNKLPGIPEEPDIVQCLVNTSNLCPETLQDAISSVDLKKRPPWKPSKDISGHFGCITCVTVDSRNQWFATGSIDKTVKLWDLESGDLRLSIRAHRRPVRAVTMSSRYPFLFTCGDDNKVKCWSLDYGKKYRSYNGHLSGVRSMALLPFHNSLVTAGQDCTLLVWDIRTNGAVYTLKGHSAAITKVLAPPSGTQIVTASRDRTIKLWDFVAGKLMYTIRNHHMLVSDLVFDAKHNTFVSGATDSIKQWQYPDGNFVQTLRAEEAYTNCFAMSPQGVLVSGNVYGSLDFWDATFDSRPFRGFRTHSASMKNPCSVFSMAFDNSGTKLITAGADGNIKMFEKEI